MRSDGRGGGGGRGGRGARGRGDGRGRGGGRGGRYPDYPPAASAAPDRGFRASERDFPVAPGQELPDQMQRLHVNAAASKPLHKQSQICTPVPGCLFSIWATSQTILRQLTRSRHAFKINSDISSTSPRIKPNRPTNRPRPSSESGTPAWHRPTRERCPHPPRSPHRLSP